MTLQNRLQTGCVSWLTFPGERKELKRKSASHSQNLQLLPGFPAPVTIRGIVIICARQGTMKHTATFNLMFLSDVVWWLETFASGKFHDTSRRLLHLLQGIRDVRQHWGLWRRRCVWLGFCSVSTKCVWHFESCNVYSLSHYTQWFGVHYAVITSTVCCFSGRFLPPPRNDFCEAVQLNSCILNHNLSFSSPLCKHEWTPHTLVTGL